MSIDISGAKILFELPLGITITETQVNSWIVMIVITLVCIWLTRGLKVRPESKRQVVAEYIVKTVKKLVSDNMSERFGFFAPFIGAALSLSALSSLSGLLTMFPPTADLNTTLGWSVVVFVIITYYKIKTDGMWNYLKGYTKPVFILTPINIIGEIATPLSMAFRHFGNIVSGVVVSALIYSALAAASGVLYGALGLSGTFISDIMVLQIGLPAIFSIYFDVFSGCLQAFIFSMLTMVYVKMGAGVED